MNNKTINKTKTVSIIVTEDFRIEGTDELKLRDKIL